MDTVKTETEAIYSLETQPRRLNALTLKLAGQHGLKIGDRVRYATRIGGGESLGGPMSVYLSTRTVGQHFGTCGVVRRVGDGRVVAKSDTVRPYGFTGAALEDAEALATCKGWSVVSIEGA